MIASNDYTKFLRTTGVSIIVLLAVFFIGQLFSPSPNDNFARDENTPNTRHAISDTTQIAINIVLANDLLAQVDDGSTPLGKPVEPYIMDISTEYPEKTLPGPDAFRVVDNFHRTCSNSNPPCLNNGKWKEKGFVLSETPELWDIFFTYGGRPALGDDTNNNPDGLGDFFLTGPTPTYGSTACISLCIPLNGEEKDSEIAWFDESLTRQRSADENPASDISGSSPGNNNPGNDPDIVFNPPFIPGEEPDNPFDLPTDNNAPGDTSGNNTPNTPPVAFIPPANTPPGNSGPFLPGCQFDCEFIPESNPESSEPASVPEPGSLGLLLLGLLGLSKKINRAL